MYGDMKKLDEVMAEYDKVSPTFCMAKWMHVSLHLLNGRTHSCYLPQTHKIPLDEVKKDPSALHNTSHKKQQRKMMLSGERPAECSICWNVEDLPGNQVSDRKLRALESWTMKHFDQVKQMPWDASINPSYVEVSFSHLCNFACTYCSPAVSSRWEKLVREEGPYLLSEGGHNDLEWIKQAGLSPLDEENNPYIEAFWKWWPDLVKGLLYFRVTGGEPLLSKHTYALLDWIDQNPQPHLTLEFNSNLGIPEVHFDRFIKRCVALSEGGKIKKLSLYTSIDTIGEQAEYVRDGLDFNKFEANLKRFTDELPSASVNFMCTMNNLSLVRFKELLQWFMELRQVCWDKNHRGGINIDLPHLVAPFHQSIQILTPDFQLVTKDLVEFMEKSSSEHIGPTGFRNNEISKMRRIHQMLKETGSEPWIEKARKDFYLFFSEYDRRRGRDFLKVFPEMRLFWQTCRHLVEQDQARKPMGLR